MANKTTARSLAPARFYFAQQLRTTSHLYRSSPSLSTALLFLPLMG
jgi:hypothetical protein